MNLKIITPAKLVFEGQVEEVYLPGDKGEFGILSDHAELVCSLAGGMCRFTKKGGSVERLALDVGACHVAENEVVVLARSAVGKGEADQSESRARLAAIEGEMTARELTDERRNVLEASRAFEQAKLDLAS